MRQPDSRIGEAPVDLRMMGLMNALRGAASADALRAIHIADGMATLIREIEPHAELRAAHQAHTAMWERYGRPYLLLDNGGRGPGTEWKTWLEGDYKPLQNEAQRDLDATELAYRRELARYQMARHGRQWALRPGE